VAWAVVLGCAIWLHRLIRHHARVTRGEPRLVSTSGRIANDEQALLSWMAVAWVVLALCQLAVTVAGNLAVLPLTGVTFPFVSFGMTSLLVNMAMLALAINVTVPERERHG
jgi:cell division protein FtsW (lipid II flippase)